MDKSDKSKNLDYDHTLAFWSIQVKLNQNQSREAESRDVVSVLYRSFLALVFFTGKVASTFFVWDNTLEWTYIEV